MTLSTTHHSAPSLPPISMFTSRSQPPTSLMPASPPSSGYDNHSSLSILPKPFYKERPDLLLSPPQNYYGNNKIPPTTIDTYPSSSSSSASSSSSSSSSTTVTPTKPDQDTLWALFNQFQKEQEKNKSTENRRGSETNIQQERGLSSEEVLAEKRRRNAGASARFRDRRKQRERELLDKCNELEQRVKEVENALRRVDPEHALLLTKRPVDRSMSPSPTTTTPTTSAEESDHTLFDRVGQLEHLMTRFRKEKETDVQKLDELEKENKYLKSLLVPVSLSNTIENSSHKYNHKRIRLSSSDIEN